MARVRLTDTVVIDKLVEVCDALEIDGVNDYSNIRESFSKAFTKKLDATFDNWIPVVCDAIETKNGVTQDEADILDLL